ncbi:hydroxypyruvate reductase [Thiocapsa imhoffii]|uniref:Hydroxypyruvate reductase n=1 Tax=Thiocapsa imhoffii TaxID=382777 RepID=A0A9X1BBA1_9GAMM|nr:DUF4147 domain-containing protein [Thiocapsa imhoffii]MBK1646535.1 hydroxypyruvate reductase [Thiocapsa imhoffii]
MDDLVRPRRQLLDIYSHALRAVDGRERVRRTLADTPLPGPLWCCAIGKAAASMTLGACDALGTGLRGGLLITKDGHLPSLTRGGRDAARLAAHGIIGLVAGHPLPDARSLAAGARLLDWLATRPADARFLFLISGGASSLVEVPIAGLGLAEVRRLNDWLLSHAIPIETMNRVRAAVSRIKGGGLLGALHGRPARVLAISDVPGNDPSLIGSGLLAPMRELPRHLAPLALPAWLRDWVERGLAERPADLAPGPAIELVATLDMALEAAAVAGRGAGLPVWRHEQSVVGEAGAAGHRLAAALRAGPPGLHVWGGETTVSLPAVPGRGGRNQHLALAAAIELAGRTDLLLLSAGTDGSDGPSEDAGALVDGLTLQRVAEAGFDARDALTRADSGTVLEASGDLIRTGPTGTNVTDLMLGWRS